MVELTEDEKFEIAMKSVSAISKEAATLWEQGHKKGAQALLDYLVKADINSLVLFYDVFTSFRGAKPE